MRDRTVSRPAALAALLLLALAGAARAAELPAPLVDTRWLAEHLDEVLVLDVRGDPRTYSVPPRWHRDRRTGRRYLAQLGGHVPGAVLVEYGEEPVVIVTEGLGPGDMTIATRVYWQLKYYGHDNVAILDGGRRAEGAPGALAGDGRAPRAARWRSTSASASPPTSTPTGTSRAPRPSRTSST